jgi:hypothetical protein
MNKQHFEEREKKESVQHVKKIQYVYLLKNTYNGVFGG